MLDAITTVYSYYLPEVRKLVGELTQNYPHDVFLRSVKPGLDDFHQPIIDQLIERQRAVSGLHAFPHRYPTAGSEEGIREILSQLQLQGVKQIYMYRADYEGYREVAKTRGITTIEIDPAQDPRTLSKGYWFLSNPSARDGNLLPKEKIDAICEAGHQLFYDLSYLGSTKPDATYDLSQPNVFAAAISFSKPYGLFYYRVGFTFTRQEVPALYANKWFKNIFGLLLAKKIIQELDLEKIATKYKEIQSQIIAEMNAKHELGLKPSDTFLLAHLSAAGAAHLDAKQREMIARFARADTYRFCLTPYYLARE